MSSYLFPLLTADLPSSFPFVCLLFVLAGKNNNTERATRTKPASESLEDTEEADEEDKEEDEDEDDEVEEDLVVGEEQELQAKMATMSVTAPKLTMKLPFLLYPWNDETGRKHCSIDIMLLSGTTVDQIKPTIHKNGTQCIIKYDYPRAFLMGARRLAAQSNYEIGPAHAKATALQEVVTQLQDTYESSEPAALMVIKLPSRSSRIFVKIQ